MTKAIILAAGQGTRLRALTDHQPKCMVKYQGVPLIERSIASLRECGIKDITLVTGYCAEKLDYLGLKTCRNERYATTNMVESLFCAESELQGELVISYSDIIYSPRVVQALLESRADISVVVDTRWEELWRQRMEDPLADAETLRLASDGSIVELGKKPSSRDDIEGQYIGLIKLSAKGASDVRAFYHSIDRSRKFDGRPFEQMFMTSFIQGLIDNGTPVQAVPVPGGWLEVDCPADLETSPIDWQVS